MNTPPTITCGRSQTKADKAIEQQQATVAAAAARRETLERQRQEQAAAERAMDREIIGEWCRRLEELEARLTFSRTEPWQGLVDRLRVRLGVAMNDVEQAGFGSRRGALKIHRSAANEMDAEIIGEWSRRLADLAARMPVARTEHGRELVGRLRVRLAIALNDIELEFGHQKK
jgi:hypothetical protein